MTTHLNLARKLRSKQFDQIIGQDIAVGILKNSLYLDKIFPVYLFSGQHGCGKTTTARVFAAAINCQQLPDFQKAPQEILVPCGTCASCTALAAGKHPDFIEMDAASNTGVDNVRTIIEAASLLPQLGRKKIYLIDEAHMLSKAAFNAFLKILEEPPAHVFFILATTDEHKIIDTVKSRCFHLIFNAVDHNVLCTHLQRVCEQERITYETPALELIIKETHGSVRDALNLVEQVALSKQTVTAPHVRELLGHICEELIHQLCVHILQTKAPRELLEFLQHINLAQFNAEHVWQRLLHHTNAMLWLKHDVTPTGFTGDIQEIKNLVSTIPANTLHTLFQELCEQEVVFLRTLNKPLFIEYTLMRAWYCMHETPAQEHTQVEQKIPRQPIPTQQHSEPIAKTETTQERAFMPNAPEAWIKFVQAIDALNEPLLASLFKQAHVQSHTEDLIVIAFMQRLMLFQDTITTLQQKWLPLLQQHFGPQAHLETQFTLTDQSPTISTPADKIAPTPTPTSCTPIRSARLDVSDKNQWPLTHKLLEEFPGTVSECTEQSS